MKKFSFFFFCFIYNLSYTVNAQFTLGFTTQENHGCNGNPCTYTGPSILINEVMLTPITGDGSVFDLNNTRRGEWIELYNPDQCKSVDISCYYLGNNSPDFDDYGGGYRIPANTIVPPMGFVVIRGMNTPSVLPTLLVQNGGTTIELIVDNLFNNICISPGGNRLWFPNAGGWFAFYDNNGIPQDAISWNSKTNACTNCQPCIPDFPGCSNATSLPSYDSIPANRKTYITSQDPFISRGKSWRRTPDGAFWNFNAAIPTMGSCNTVCNPPPFVTCNGKATVSVSGGTPPYTYKWDTPFASVSNTASGLCKGTYCVIVTDAMNIQQTACTEIKNFIPSLTFNPIPVFYLNNEKPLDLNPFVQPKGGYFSGPGVMSPNFYATNVGIGTYTITYDYADSWHCKNSITQKIEVLPGSELLIPNFLTPNGDDLYDEFKITHFGIVNFRCTIFNRWGKQIYEWFDINKGWNGKTNNGSIAAEGVYYYVLIAKGYDNIVYDRNGSITLLK